MRFEDILRNSRTVSPGEAATARWRRAIFAPQPEAEPGWIPGLVSGLAMAGMLLLLWPAAARGPVALRSTEEACDGRLEVLVPLRADLSSVARPQLMPAAFHLADRCALCHLDQTQ